MLIFLLILPPPGTVPPEVAAPLAPSSCARAFHLVMAWIWGEGDTIKQPRSGLPTYFNTFREDYDAINMTMLSTGVLPSP